MDIIEQDYFVGDIVEEEFFGRQPLEIIKADITELEVNCIVNAANSNLRMGGVVCGAIFRKAGAKASTKRCSQIFQVRPIFPWIRQWHTSRSQVRRSGMQRKRSASPKCSG